jgi:hypothetical protein
LENITTLVLAVFTFNFQVSQKARKLSLPIDILLLLFDVMVAPILLYGAEVWGYEKNDIKFTISKTEDFDICTFCKSVH